MAHRATKRRSASTAASKGVLGILANPASGKDVRRLVSRASVFDNQEKCAIVVRALTGALAAGVQQVAYFNDKHGIARNALDTLKDSVSGTITAEAVEVDATGTALDTIAAARALRDAGCRAVIVLGGDGTSRAFALGWRDATLMPLSTGTNNVFPELLEATIAGTAAGLIASGAIGRRARPQAAKLIDLQIEGERPDLALIDAAFTTDRFVGSRALLAPERLRELLLTRADPAAVGMTSIGGLLSPVSASDDHGLQVSLSDAPSHSSRSLTAPIAPGYYQSVHVTKTQKLKPEQPIEWVGPGVIALDGERERFLKPGQTATLSLQRTGPRVINANDVMQAAAKCGAFVQNAASLEKQKQRHRNAKKRVAQSVAQ